MRVNKRVLASMHKAYAVCAVQPPDGDLRLAGKTHFLAATETRGPCLLFSPPDWRTSVVWEGPGGTMGLAALPGKEQQVLAVQGRFSIAESQQACLVRVEPGSSLTGAWRVTHFSDLPYIHRFEILRVETDTLIVAATLCGEKDGQGDLSEPGAVYLIPVPEAGVATPAPVPILTGISKNHGLHSTVLDGRPALLVAGSQGIFRLEIPQESRGTWHSERLVDGEVSDIFAADLDEDGAPEILAIQPFHGNQFVIYKRHSNAWRPVYTMPLEFGHVVWGGSLLGRPAALVGGRAGARELTLLRPVAMDPLKMEAVTIDAGVGPNQIVVVHQDGRELILSANHGAGQIALYELTE